MYIQKCNSLQSGLSHSLSKVNAHTVLILFDYAPWALIKILDLESGLLFKVGAYSRLGTY